MMSKLLIHEAPLQVLPTLAVKLGVNEAMVLQQLHYWLNRSSKIINEKPWIYNTYQDWLKQFPFWSHKTMQRILLSLEERGLVESANHNPKKSDKTKWYTINHTQLDKLERGANASPQHDPNVTEGASVSSQNHPDESGRQTIPTTRHGIAEGVAGKSGSIQ